MKLDQAMKALERAGSATTRKTYLRHGVKEPVLGVSYAVLYALQKQIGRDQELAEALWETGVHDARVLATLVADGEKMPKPVLQRWCKGAGDRGIALAFGAVAARSAPGLACALKWIDAKAEYEQAAGWFTLAGLAGGRTVGDEVFAPLLPRLERVVHRLPNFARYAANNCLIAIGTRPGLAAEAMRVAKAVGRVEVDHGDTACKTPVASEYIAKMAARAKGKGRAATAERRAAGGASARQVGSGSRGKKARPKAAR